MAEEEEVSLLHIWVPTKETESKLESEEKEAKDKEDVPRNKEDVADDDPKKVPFATAKSKEEKETEEQVKVVLNATTTGSRETATKSSEEEGQNATEESTEMATKSSEEEDFVKRLSLEDSLQQALDMLGVRHSAWNLSRRKDFWHVSLCVPSSCLEDSLLCLQRHGVGSAPSSSVSVVGSQLHFGGGELFDKKDGAQQQEDEENADDNADDAVVRFFQSVKSRLLVAEVVRRIRSGAQFNFDFLMLLFLAAFISFMGLLENSSVTLVASMLVSPLMGPILAGVFGAVVRDADLVRTGVRNEAASLGACVLAGLALGMAFLPWYPSPNGQEGWPTEEMASRGRPRALLSGILVAVPSGAGVALSVLGGNSGSLVGVAISASLLPPAVNCGLLWALAILSAVYGEDEEGSFFRLEFKEEFSFSDRSRSAEAFFLGLSSLFLTVLNILCIIVTGVSILWLKEVTPEKVPQSFPHFWRRDVRTHREYYRTRKGDSLAREAKEALGIREEGLAGTFLQGMFEGGGDEEDEDRLDIMRWVAPPPVAPRPKRTKPKRSPLLRQSTFWEEGRKGRGGAEEVKLLIKMRGRSKTFSGAKGRLNR